MLNQLLFILTFLVVVLLGTWSYAGETHKLSPETALNVCTQSCHARGGVWYLVLYGEKIEVLSAPYNYKCKCVDDMQG
jgi:hypothetical protein